MNPSDILKRMHTAVLDYEYPDPGDTNDIAPDRQFAICRLASTAAETRTLKDPLYPGQRLTLAMKTDGGDITITADSAVDQAGNTSLVFGDIGDMLDLVGIEDGSDLEWRVVGAQGVAGIGEGDYLPLAGGTMDDGANIALATGTGTEIGTAVAQKLGFWGVTPVVQPSGAGQAAVTDSSNGSGSTVNDVGTMFSQSTLNNNFFAVVTLLNAMRTALVDSGIMKGAA